MGYENNDVVRTYSTNWFLLETTAPPTALTTTVATTTSTTSSTSTTSTTTSTTTSGTTSMTVPTTTTTTEQTTSTVRSSKPALTTFAEPTEAWDASRLDLTETKNEINWKQLVCKTERWRERNPRYCKNCKKQNCDYDLYSGRERAARRVCLDFPVTDQKC